jgi:hypothetical protein
LRPKSFTMPPKRSKVCRHLSCAQCQILDMRDPLMLNTTSNTSTSTVSASSATFCAQWDGLDDNYMPGECHATHSPCCFVTHSPCCHATHSPCCFIWYCWCPAHMSRHYTTARHTTTRTHSLCTLATQCSPVHHASQALSVCDTAPFIQPLSRR